MKSGLNQEQDKLEIKMPCQFYTYNKIQDLRREIAALKQEGVDENTSDVADEID